MAHAEEAIALARRLDHKYSQAIAFAVRRTASPDASSIRRAVLACAELAVQLCERYEFGYYVTGRKCSRLGARP